MKNGERLKIAIVGARRGGGHTAAIAAAGNRVEFAGVYDPSVATMEAFINQQGSGKQYSSFEAAVDDSDLIVLASPQQYHAPQAAYALRAGVHVLSEVPAAVSMEQVSELLAAARASSASPANSCKTWVRTASSTARSAGPPSST